jgi:hypothetical protein
MKRAAVFALAASGLALSACQKDYHAPFGPKDQNVCYEVVIHKDGSPEYVPIAKDQKTLEACAAVLDAGRRRYVALGGRTTMTGAYNGQFLFFDSGGMSTAPSLNGGRFLAFARAGNGQLAIPSYIKQAPPEAGAPASAAASQPASR